MEFILDNSLEELGIHEIVVAKVTGLDAAAELTPAFLEELDLQVKRAESMDLDILRENTIVNGYRELVQSVNRSLKKYPPAAEALIKTIQRKGAMPKINSIVDIYNLETVRSYLSIGAHDLTKIDFPLEFTVSKKEDIFYPIMSNEKKVADYDFVYRDQKGILAYLGCRDSENYKINEDTTDILFVIQGNAYTTTEYRLDALQRILDQLQECMPNISYTIQVIKNN
ncbi:MAG: B3/B4 domain-containing protein [Vagococcus sp.]